MTALPPSASSRSAPFFFLSSRDPSLHHTARVPLVRADRYLDQTARQRELTVNSIAALNAFNMKYFRETATQGGILGGDPVRPPMPIKSKAR